MALDKEGMLEGYKPAGYADIKDGLQGQAHRHADLGRRWTPGPRRSASTPSSEKQGLPKPETWKDLLKPVYAGKIVMPNPNSSGTGFLDVAAWLQIFGEKGGWEYMDGLHKNINTYLHSGSKPCKAAGAGEYPIGISFSYPGVVLKNQGAPLEIILPKDGTRLGYGSDAIMKGTKNEAGAKALADFAATSRREQDVQ